MNKYLLFFKTNWFPLSVWLILLLALSLQFFNYPSRWGLAYDQAHDAIIARYALENFKLPLLGPFSSGGPFQTGGEWYWLIMMGTALIPFTVLGPWIVISFLYVVFVGGMMLLGNKIGGRALSLILGCFAAVSPAHVKQGLNLTNQTPQALVALLTLLCVYEYLTSRKRIYLFLLALCISLGSSIHLQAIALTPLLVMTLILSGMPRITDLLIITLGLFIPWIPVFIIDSTREFTNTKNMIQYYLHDQYKISLDVLGRRWLTYAGVFIPTQWGNIIGGIPILGYGIITMTGGVALFSLIKKSIPKIILATLGTVFFSIILLRYTRTPLFDSYLVFLHPLILLISGWSVFVIFQKNKWIGISLFILITGMSSFVSIKEGLQAENRTATDTDRRISVLMSKYPDKKFSVYTYNYRWTEINAPLTLFLDSKKLISEDGEKIGIIVASTSADFVFPVIDGKLFEYQTLDLSSSTSAQLIQNGWIRINPVDIYRETQEWYHYKN